MGRKPTGANPAPCICNAKETAPLSIESNRPLALYTQAPAAIKSIANQEMTGGPRGGSGAAVRAAMCATGMEAGHAPVDAPPAAGSAISAAVRLRTHNGQSSVWLGMSCAPSSVLTTSLTAPEPRQINSTGFWVDNGRRHGNPYRQHKPRQHEAGEPSKAAKGLQGHRVACGGIRRPRGAGRDTPFRFMTQVNSATPALRTGF